jgi:hypothetical protein
LLFTAAGDVKTAVCHLSLPTDTRARLYVAFPPGTGTVSIRRASLARETLAEFSGNSATPGPATISIVTPAPAISAAPDSP